MGMFGIDGLSSGLDTTSLINQLMQVEGIPQQKLQLNMRTQTSSVTAYQIVASRLKSAETAVAELGKDAAWNARTTTVTGTSVTATTGAGALAGSSTIEVKSLASAARSTSVLSFGLDDDVATAGATITVATASGDPVSFVAESGSLRDVVAAFNEKSAETGVTAVAVRVGADAYKLQLRSNESGEDAAFEGVTGLSALMGTVDGGADAVYEIDGVEGRSATNSVTDILPGVTVSLAQIGTSTINVAADSGKTTAAVKAMVDAVNAALSDIETQTKNDPAATTRAPLSSDNQVRAIAGDLLRSAADALGGRSPAEIGIQTTREGRLVLDEAVFAKALADDPAGTRAMLAPAAVTVGAVTTTPDGLSKRLTTVLERATNADTGTITNAVQGREQRVKDLQLAIDSWDRRLETRRSNLQRQFSGLEVALGRMQSQSSWLSGQLAGLSNNWQR
ncbi:flagellar filament capping protein FliD [Aquipuribacter sp. MA13-6]|uniref:flagellar filament capping protein FliD n=1 Tax=unclassified Aquipuribacter TaxID=2635084 RepID=UPI003EEB194B